MRYIHTYNATYVNCRNKYVDSAVMLQEAHYFCRFVASLSTKPNLLLAFFSFSLVGWLVGGFLCKCSSIMLIRNAW